MNNLLQTMLSLAIVFGILTACFFPNPFLSHTFLPQDFQVITDFYDIEETAQTAPLNKKAVILDWETCINPIWDCFISTELFDFLTKKSLFVQRTGGSYHADIEPTSPDDTKILEDILKKHKTSRIPVLIKINGMWVCASLGNNVHGFGLISNNNLSGHLCLHFLNSKTTIKKIDPLHQNSVITALELSKKIFPKN